MKITKLSITQDELNLAVQSYLSTRGISLPVKEVKKAYDYEDSYYVKFKEEPETLDLKQIKDV